MPHHNNSAELLGPEGPFIQSVTGFRPRSTQQQFAAAVEQCFHESSVLVAESGTGTGKTFAYLVPAMMSGKKVVLSTGTKPLQDQLFHRDIPTVADALKVSVKATLLKGRANYLCIHRKDIALGQLDLGDKVAADLSRVEQWSKVTKSGDVNELKEVQENSLVWPMATSTADNCLGTSCAHYDKCFVNRARRSAMTADIVVINHHLFCADLALKEDGFGQLLPTADIVIFDEAHQLPSVASNFLGVSLSAHQIRELCADTRREEQKEQSLVQGLDAAIIRVEQHRDQLCSALRHQRERVDWAKLVANSEFGQAVSDLTGAVSILADLLEAAASAGEGLTRCWGRALSCAELLDRFSARPQAEFIRWAEVSKSWFRFHETPLRVGTSLGPYLDDSSKSWLYTSATLSVDGNFNHFVSQLGIEDPMLLDLESPFNFAAQGLLYIPTGLPDPRDPEHTRTVVDKALPIIRANKGRTFLLFTSHQALRKAHEYLLVEENITATFNLLVQGHAPRSELLDRFRNTPHSVLLGTASFWEGVDVRGSALSSVIIDKLPFASPGDPVLRARLVTIEEQGGNPFMDYQLPSAVISLKQGVGRLIRDTTDHGLLMLCDSRLFGKSYGKVFLNSLPPFTLTREQDQVLRFLENIQ